MHTDQRSKARLYIAWALAAAFGFACGGSTPAAPSPPPAAAAPTVTGIGPALGPTAGGLGVTLTGTGFVAGATLSIGGTAASSVTVASATSMTATTPAHAAGAVDIVVTNPDGQSGRLSGGFTYDVPAIPSPSIAAVAPATGPTSGGTLVNISGAGFVQGVTVSFGATAATAVTVASPSSLTVTAPARGAGRVDLVVANPDGQSGRLTDAFTYVGSAPPAPPAPPSPPAPVAPTITAIAPASATTAGGTSVTLTGTGFAAGAAVTFDGAAASNAVVASATSITATTPPHAAGAVDVVVTNTDGLSGRLNGGFTYTAPAPPPPPPPATVVITITPAGVSPSDLSITVGTRVRFVNNDALPHAINSDPHPGHTQCPEINLVGLLLPGQSRETSIFSTRGSCGYHDHNDPDEPRWTGTIQIR